MRRRLTITVVCALVALGMAACSGDDSTDADSTGTTSGLTTEPAPPTSAAAGTDDPAPGKTLLQFVKAAGRGDAEAMWGLLSEPTKASIGPTFQDFRSGVAEDFQAGLGSLAPTAKVTLSRKLDDNWSVAAVSGERETDGKAERYSYGAAFSPENGKLKLELGGIVVAKYTPEPLAEVSDRRPEVGANVGTGGTDIRDLRLWLDGKPLPFRRGPNDTPFTAMLRGRPAAPLAKGEHQAMIFAATDSDATASAWPFTVK